MRFQSNKDKFTYLLKQYIVERHGEGIVKRLDAAANESKKERMLRVMIEFDLTDMLFYDGFLAENFIKCFYRYYSRIADFIKEIYVDHLSEVAFLSQGSALSLNQHDSVNQIHDIMSTLSNEIFIEAQIVLTHFPTTLP